MYHSAVPAIEPIIITEERISGIHSIEDLGDGVMLFTLYRKQRRTYDGEWEHVIVARYTTTPRDGTAMAFLVAKMYGLSVYGPVENLPKGESTH